MIGIKELQVMFSITTLRINLTHIKNKIKENVFIFPLISFLWLLFRSGQKPSRISYPCQKAAAVNLGIFGSMVIYSPGHKILPLLEFKKKLLFKYSFFAFVILIVLMGSDSIWSKYNTEKNLQEYQIQNNIGTVGIPLTFSGGITTQYLTIPHALSLPSPHRVVGIFDPDATNWTYCTSGCPYYGDDSYVNQTVVDRMVDSGVMELTGTTSVSEAWAAIIPNYSKGEKIAIKLNFNDAIIGGGISGYGDNDAYVDAIPQPINSLIKGLKTIGVEESDIWIYDASRYVTDRFRNRIHYSNISYFDHYGNGNDVHLATFNSLDPTAQIDFSGTGYVGSHKVTDVLVNATYLINMPIFKRHGGTGITLSLKNHLGSIEGFYTAGSYSLHDYFYLWGNGYRSSSNPLVNINNNIHIKNKTVLIIGDALYGAWPDNNQPPRRWNSYGSDSPNMLFFSADPVAVDSVMYDYLWREGSFDVKSEDILIVAANAGLGVHERWNNNIDRRYNTIDYREINTSQNRDSGDNSKWKNYSRDSTIRLMQATSDIRLDHLVNDYKNYWSLDEGTGVIIYDENITSNNTGILSGTVWNTTGGLDFDGSDHISLVNVTSLSGNYTFVAWFNRKDSSIVNSFTGKTQDTPPSSKIAFPSSNSGIMTRLIPGGGSTIINVGYTPSMDNTWNFITMQRDENNSMKASLNGGSLISGSVLPGTYNFNLLGRNADGQSMYGTMKNIAVWSRVLNSTEINLVREGKRYQNGNVTFWYDAGNGNIISGFTINATTPAGSNYSIWYRQNNTGNYMLLASNLRDNQNIIIAGAKYQNTDLKIQLFGDGLVSPRIQRIKSNIQDSSYGDSTSPMSITNLRNVTYSPYHINWTWTDPQNIDFDHVMIYISNNFRFNVSKGIRFYNATNLNTDTSYTISTHTVDTSGNINQTWVNHTAKTDKSQELKNGSDIKWINYSHDRTIRIMQATGDIRLDHIVNDYKDYWSLEEGTGVIIHDENITSNNTGILSDTTWNTTGGLDFDGSDHISLTNVTSLSGNYTFVAWFNRKDYSIVNSFTGKTQDTFPSSKIAFPSSNSGIMTRLIPGGGSTVINVVYIPSMDNTWNFITMQRDENNIMKASLNGGKLILGSVLPGTYNFNLLGRNADGQSMYGTLKNIGVWSRVLNSTEINLVREEKRYQNGNVTFWYDAGNGNIISGFTINATTPAGTNYSIWYRQNNTGNYMLLASNLRDNQNIIIAGAKYQNTDLKIQLFGNEISTPKISAINFIK